MKFKTKIANKQLTVETEQLAQQANGSVVVKYGDTVVLVTATLSKSAREGVTYLPLMVNYEEKFYAAGKIKGSRWIKREGKPTEEAVLTGRMIDRTIRPLFNQNIRQDIQVIATVFSIDEKNDPDLLALWGASLALGISDIPWNGPISGARITGCQEKDELIVNPNYQQREKGNFELIVSGDGEKINMIEGDAQELPEKKFLKAIEKSLPCLQKLQNFQKKIIKKIGANKLKPKEISQEKPSSKLKNKFQKFIKDNKKLNLKELEEKFKEKFNQEERNSLGPLFTKTLNKKLKNLVKQGKRPDGRGLEEVRPLSSRVNIFPRTHGSATFNRGKTQVAATVTLGGPGEEKFLDTMEVEGRKRFLLHYNFPPFAPGETAPLRAPSRREIGHGNLAENALKNLMPPQDSFPYTVRVVSEVLSSNGSTSMASVCAGSLALMDAGVPLKKPVAGIALGLMADKFLVDIQGPEDHFGFMDLKLAGTKDGLTAWQMDVKNEGVSLDKLKKAVQKSLQARLKILKSMQKAIGQPRKELSPLAPRVSSIKIPQEKIRDLIGPGGKTINNIIEKTGAEIDISDEGIVSITSQKAKGGKKAQKLVKQITKKIKPGDVSTGEVVRITDFGAFVELSPVKDGLIHISDLSEGYTEKVSDEVKEGDKVKVKVKEIDDQGKIGLLLLSK